MSDREDIKKRKNRLPFYSIIPLKEILSEITETGVTSKRISGIYNNLMKEAGPELELLLNLPVNEVPKFGREILPEAISRMRDKKIYIKEGFDGEYGRINVFQKGEKFLFDQQESFFKAPLQKNCSLQQERKLLNFDLKEYRRLKKGREEKKIAPAEITEVESSASRSKPGKGLNLQQQEAVEYCHGAALILAGPGTGKTRVLTYRILNLIQKKKVPPENIIAITFTNKAADEMKKRLKTLIKDIDVVSRLTVSTFHALGFSILKKHAEKTGRDEKFYIIDEEDKKLIISQEVCAETRESKNISNAISEAKQNMKSGGEIADVKIAEYFNRYETILLRQNTFDLDDLIYQAVKLFSLYPEILKIYRKQYRWIMIDEYQDINFAQYQMIRTLCPEANSNLCVIGDPNQAIYGFRGADVKFINEFIADYPKSAVYRLGKS